MTLDHGYPVARKEHVCGYCGEPIPAGQRYHTWVCIQDGSASTVKAHIACNDIAADCAKLYGHYHEGWDVCLEQLSEWAVWSRPEPIPPRLAALAAAATVPWPAGELARMGANLEKWSLQ